MPDFQTEECAQLRQLAGQVADPDCAMMRRAGLRPVVDKRFCPAGNPPHQWVFYYPQDPTQRAHGFRTAFENAREKAGLPHLRSYDLRHMFCSFALMNGVDKDLLRQWMGHKSTQMIDEVYLHFLDDYRKQQMRKMRIDLPDDCKAMPASPIILPPPLWSSPS